MAGNFYYIKILISGDENEIGKFERSHFRETGFDFDSVIPMPKELDLDFDNLVETGFEALYGDWKKISSYWMFKEPAQRLGYLFPLESREQVVNCLKSFDCADSYLEPARRFKKNLEIFGHGARATWREANWGARGNPEGVKVWKEQDALVLWLVSDGYPSKLIKKLSCLYPDLNFKLTYFDDCKRIGRTLLVKNGRETDKQKIAPDEVLRLSREYQNKLDEH